MTALIPMAMYGLEVPAGDIAISARPDIPSAFRITMAAIDPTAEAGGVAGGPIRATLKVIRQPLGLDDLDDEGEDSDEDDFDVDEMDRILAEGDSDDDDDDDDEILNGGPSDPAKSKKARVQAKIMRLLEANGGMDVDDDEEEDDDDEILNGLSAKAKGKLPAGEDDSEDEDDDDDLEGEMEEYVICTLDPAKNYQQALDITFGEDERVWFKVTGTHNIFLTGNYVETLDDRSRIYDAEDDEDEYDLEPDSDELDDEFDEEDELDELDDIRVEEIEEDDEVEAPKLVATKSGKSSNKRSAPDDEVAETLDEMITAEKLNGEKLSKKQQKKQKKNDGTAVSTDKKEAEVPSSNKSEKKVAFAKELEQGPTPTKTADKPKAKAAATVGVKVVQGVTIDDKTIGTGPAAKAGDRVGMRYIGKLKDGKVFDSNKKGKPFSFKLGSGEVIKGWDIGVAGMSVGGERRITIPAHLAYGSRGSPPSIPPNAPLTFDLKVLEINKGK